MEIRGVIKNPDLRIMKDPPGFGNPCAEQLMGEIYHRPELLGVSVVNKHIIEGEWVMTREWLNTCAMVQVDMSAVVSFKWTLEEMTQDLSLADVWHITLFVTLSTGHEYDVTDLPELVKFVRGLDGDKQYAGTSENGSLAYYVSNLAKYEEMVTRAEKLADG